MSASPRPESNTTAAAACAALLVIAYAVFAACLINAPLLDFPNHLARAWILGDLMFDQGKTFGDYFSWTPELAPYLGPDILLAAMLRLFGVKATTGVWISAAVIGQPLAVLYLLRTYRCSVQAIVVGVSISLVLATDWFFTSGFINYRLSIPIAIVGFAAFTRFMRSASVSAYVLFVFSVVMAYVFHLSAYIMLGVAVAASLAYDLFARRLHWRNALLCCGPLAAVGLVHVALTLANSGGGVLTTSWGSLSRKLLRLASSVLRFDAIEEIGILTMLALPLAWIVLRYGYPSNSDREARRCSVLAGAFFLVYFALPIETGGVYDVDNRALPYVLMFLLIAFLLAYDSVLAVTRIVPASVVAGCLFNLCIVAMHIWPTNKFLADYRSLAAKIPRGSLVLPIATRPDVGRYQGVVHAGSFITLDTGNLTPYLFARDLNPNISYFAYRHERPYAPGLFWYTRNVDDVDWGKVESTYDFVLVTKPYDPARLSPRLSLVAENSSAAILKAMR